MPDPDAPVTDESTYLDLEVGGEIPGGLAGTYLRIGPNPIAGRDAPDAMVHAVSLDHGRAVAYRNRWISTDATSRTLGTEPVPGPPPTSIDRADESLVRFDGRLFAVADGSLAYELTLDGTTLRRVDLAGDGRGIGAFPVTDPCSGELHLLANPGTPSAAVCTLVPRDARRTRPVGAEVPVTQLALAGVHVVVVARDRVGMAPAGDPSAPFDWQDAPSLHRRRVVHAAGADGAAVLLTASSEYGLERWIAGPGREARVATVDRTPQRFVRIDDRSAGRPVRFVYAVTEAAGGSSVVTKHDLQVGSPRRKRLPRGMVAGELLFVPDGRGDPEDLGWLVGFVHDRHTARSMLAVLDAQDLETVATVHLPRRVPGGRRGLWVPAARSEGSRPMRPSWP